MSDHNHERKQNMKALIGLLTSAALAAGLSFYVTDRSWRSACVVQNAHLSVGVIFGQGNHNCLIAGNVIGAPDDL